MSTHRVMLPIVGLTCGGGGALLAERVLSRLSGVSRVYVNPATEMAYVEYDPVRTRLQDLTTAIQSAGLEAGHPMLR